MSDKTKKYLLSAIKVFASTFITLLTAMLASGTPISWTVNFWLPIIASALNSAIKAITDPAVPVSLGGTKVN
jgi:hypothetical protein